MKVSQNKYVNHDELTEILHTLRNEYPNLVDVESAGKSIEGRDIWAVTVTNKETGSDGEKPAIFVDACVHAGEVTGTQVCLYLLDYLVNNFSKLPVVTRLLNKRAFYVIPRVNPDGAEKFLTESFESWGNMRPFPERKDWVGLERCDIDENGILLLMRVPDKNGEWKVSDKDPRLMVVREPWEYDGEYYRIYPEGKLFGEGVNWNDFKVLPREFQLNMNRNYPEGWNIETGVDEGGEYPMSEPEVNAVARFIMRHKNIGTSQDYHTYGGVILRPFSFKGDDQFIPEDLEIYKKIGEVGHSLTGYKMVCVYDNFTGTFEAPRRGCMDDWGYENLGLLAIGTELWNMAKTAGISAKNDNYYVYQKRTEDEELEMLQWNDRELDGKGFIEWKQFNHPQLGNVEIGGWDWKRTYKNPPIKFLQEECSKNAKFCMYQANFLPELEIKSCTKEAICDNLYRLSLTVENAGYLPTYVMERCKKIKIAKEVTVSLNKNQNIEIVEGSSMVSLGHIQGRMRTDENFFFGEPSEGIPRKTATASWIIKVKNMPAEISFHICSEKAGSFNFTTIIK